MSRANPEGPGTPPVETSHGRTAVVHERAAHQRERDDHRNPPGRSVQAETLRPTVSNQGVGHTEPQPSHRCDGHEQQGKAFRAEPAASERTEPDMSARKK